MSKEEKGQQKGASSKGGGGKIILLMTMIGIILPFGLPTLLVCAGFLPTIVVLFTDTDPRRSGLATIGYLNLAGVLPFLIELWTKGQAMEVAQRMMTQPSTWVIMLGAAGMGHLILYAVPQAVASFVLIRQEARLRLLRDGLKELENIWGPDVATQVPIEVVRQHKGMNG